MAVPIDEDEPAKVVPLRPDICKPEISGQDKCYEIKVRNEGLPCRQGKDNTVVQKEKRIEESSFAVRFTILACVMTEMKTWIQNELNRNKIYDTAIYIKEPKKEDLEYELKPKEPSKINWLHDFVKPFKNIPKTYLEIFMLRPQEYNKFVSEKSMQCYSFKDSMQFEWARLSSFARYPVTGTSAIRLAEAGFYYEGQGDEVVCYFCGYRHNHWNTKDDPREIHKQQSPNCPFVKHNLSTVGAGRTPGQSHEPALECSGACGLTEGYHKQISPSPVKTLDTAQCEKNETVFTESNVQPESKENSQVHGTHDNINAARYDQHNLAGTTVSREPSFPTTSTVITQTSESNLYNMFNNGSRNDTQGLIRVNTRDPEQNRSLSELTSTQVSGNLGICVDTPKYPTYAIITARLSSFTGWPEYVDQTPESLATAGFFYTGTGDHCRCFFCGGGLRQWEEGDHPWTEHAKWYPNCPFVKHSEGAEFIDDVLKGKDPERRQQRVTTNLNGYSNNAAVQTILDFGYEPELVRRVYTSLTQAGVKDVSASLLLETIFEMNESHHLPASEEVTMSLNEQVPKENEYTNRGEIEHKAEMNPEHELSIRSLEEENRNLKDQQTCKICLDEPVAIVFLPCGHLAACVNCAPALRRCPICRAFIKGTLKAIM